MSNAMGAGWAYTLLTLLFVISCISLVASMKYGIKWRKAKKEKEERKQKTKEAKEERKKEAKAAKAESKRQGKGQGV
jgi:Flp pilus assembly protein TadB